MRRTKIGLAAILIGLWSLLSADTIQLGKHVFYSEDGPINIAVHAGVVARNLDSPYVMFMLYMGADDNINATVVHKDIVLVHEGKQYEMPRLGELRENYRGDSKDMTLYSSIVKDPLESSGMRFYKFPVFQDFFPSRKEATVPIREASMTGSVGFRTRAYFKNPGLKKGDKVIIQVRDKDDPDIWGGVAVIIED